MMSHHRTALICQRSNSVMSRCAERVKDPGLGSVADNDVQSPVLLVTTAVVGVFPRGDDGHLKRCPADQRGQQAGPSTFGVLDS